jgi:hypothetical protein
MYATPPECTMHHRYEHHSRNGCCVQISITTSTLDLARLIATNIAVARLLARLLKLIAAFTTLSPVSSGPLRLTQCNSPQPSDAPHAPHTSARIPPRPLYVHSITTIIRLIDSRLWRTHVEARVEAVIAALAIDHGDRVDAPST